MMNFSILILNILLFNFQLIQSFIPSINGNVLNIGFSPEGIVSFYFNELSAGITTTTYIADRHNNITKVLDCASLVWQATTNSTRLSLMKVYRKQQRPYLAYIYTITVFFVNTRFFLKRHGVWEEVSHGLFEYKLEIFKRERDLDINEFIHPAVFNVRTEHLYGLPSTIIIPYDKFDVVTVENDYEIIWERKYGSAKCTCAIIHGTLKDPKLIHLHIKHVEMHEEIFFTKKEGEFQRVEKACFYSFLNDLDIQENEKKTDEECE